MPPTDDIDRFEDRIRSRMESGSRSDLSETIDMFSRRLAGAVMVAGALIGAGIYMGGDEIEAPQYQAFTADGEVFRLNTDSGTIVACNAERCTRILRSGQDLAKDQGNTLFKVPAAQVPAQAPQQPAGANPTPAAGQPALPSTAQPK